MIEVTVFEKPMKKFSLYPLCTVLLTVITMALSSRAEVIYVSSFYEGSIIQIKADGSQSTLATNLNFPTGIALAGAGRVCVASSVTNRVVLVESNGLVTSVGRAAFGAGYTAVAFGPGGKLFLANQDANGLALMTATGASLPSRGGLTAPFGLAFDKAGNLHVAHMNTTRTRGQISQILPDGSIRVAVTNLDSPAGMAFDANGRMFVAEYRLGRIVRIDPDGNRTNLVTGLEGPQGLAFSGDGQLLVAEFFSGKISAISMSGERVVRAAGLAGPMYLAVEEVEPTAISVSVTETPSAMATLVLKGSPLSYHEVYFSSDLSGWRSLGLQQLIGGNRLRLEIPIEEGATQGFYATESR